MYSQNNEEQIILDYFRGATGIFADLGANDGETLSNTRALALAGWSGLLVEASPNPFVRMQMLYRERNDVDLFLCALASYDGHITLNASGELLGKGDVGLVSTVNEHEMSRFKDSVKYVTVDVSCLTWKSLIEKSRYKHFDFISLDIEGSEMDALPYIDLSKTSMLCIEFNGNKGLKGEYEKYLSGFKLIHVNSENLIYAK